MFKKLLITAAALTSVNVSAAGSWGVLKPKVDPITDVKTATIYTISQNRTFSVRRDMLLVRTNCSTKKMEVFNSHPWLVGSYRLDYIPTIIRFDKSKPFNINMNKSTNNKSLFLPPSHSKSFVNKMKKGSKLVMRYESSGTFVTPVFSLKGFSAALKKACK